MARWAAFSSVVAHISLLAFTTLLDLEAAHRIRVSWWWVFLPLWIFHASVVNCRCSVPGPSPSPLGMGQWNPWHGMVGLPLLLAFELLVCTYLEACQSGASRKKLGQIVDLEVVFLPLIVLQAVIMVDNFRRCIALTPEDEPINDDALHDTFPHCGVSVAMLLCMLSTVGILLKLNGQLDVTWWLVLLPLWGGEIFGMLPLCPTDPIEVEHVRRRAVTARISSHAPLPVAVRPSPTLSHRRSSATAPAQPPSTRQPPPPQPATMGAPADTTGNDIEAGQRGGDTVAARQQQHQQGGGGVGRGSSSRGGGGAEGNPSRRSVGGELVTEEPVVAVADVERSSSVAAAVAEFASDSSSDGSGALEELGGNFGPGCFAFCPQSGGLWLAAGAILFSQTLLCAMLEKPKELQGMPLEFVFAPIWALQAFLVIASFARLVAPRILALGPALSSSHRSLLSSVTAITALAEEGGKVLAWMPIADDAMECGANTDERSAILARGLAQGYNTFESSLTQSLLAEASDEETIGSGGGAGEEKKKVSRRELREKLRDLKSALREEAKTSERRRQELDYVLQEMVVCRICYEGSIDVVLIPCRHHMLCHKCARKCKHCPICRATITERMVVYPV